MFGVKFLIIVITLYGVSADWWEHEVFYQIYPRSFADSDGDGVGDLKGIKQRLSHIKDAGINSTWISPIFKSPMADFGYDISDFTQIYSEFGTVDDFKELSDEAARLGIKLILDFVPNHTSDEHEWFQLSLNRTEGYEDYYMWVNGTLDSEGNLQPPNNWISNFGNGAWTYVESRGQFYLHQFSEKQPDLNMRNPKVRQELKDVMKFWLDIGVAGFRVDAIPFFYEDIELRDEPRTYDPNATPNDYEYLEHIYTLNQPETYDLIYEWREFLDNYSRETDNVTRVMMTEAYADIQHTVLYYGDGNRKGAHFTFNFFLLTDLDINSTAYDYMFTINKWISYLPVQYVSNWVVGNHDNPRVGSRMGAERIDGINMLVMFLPGVGVTYYGEEIGMVDGYVSWEDTKDPIGLTAGPEKYQKVSRDIERTPFQWDDSKNAGFSTGNKTWLPVASNYKELNLKEQKEASQSHYKVYQELLELRKETTMKDGELIVKALNSNILTALRYLPGHVSYVYVFNIGTEIELVDLSNYIEIEDHLRIILTSVNANIPAGTRIPKQFHIGPHEAYILTVWPKIGRFYWYH